MTNRRGFLAALMALPTAAMAALCGSKLHSGGIAPEGVRYLGVYMPIERDCHICLNCQRVFILYRGRVQVGQGRFYYLCNDCIKDITHCATCGDPLSELNPESVALYLESNPSPPYDNPRTPLPPNPAYCILYTSCGPKLNFTSDEILMVDDPQSPLGVRFRRATLRMNPAGRLFREEAYSERMARGPRNLIVADCPNCTIAREWFNSQSFPTINELREAEEVTSVSVDDEDYHDKLWKQRKPTAREWFYGA